MLRCLDFGVGLRDTVLEVPGHNLERSGCIWWCYVARCYMQIAMPVICRSQCRWFFPTIIVFIVLFVRSTDYNAVRRRGFFSVGPRTHSELASWLWPRIPVRCLILRYRDTRVGILSVYIIVAGLRESWHGEGEFCPFSKSVLHDEQPGMLIGGAR